jgi:hypothetical protein
VGPSKLSGKGAVLGLLLSMEDSFLELQGCVVFVNKSYSTDHKVSQGLTHIVESNLRVLGTGGTYECDAEVIYEIAGSGERQRP